MSEAVPLHRMTVY